MSFFDSAVVRAEMSEISDLQEKVYRSAFNLSDMNKEQKLIHIRLMQKLIDKQIIAFTRLSLSEDDEAKQFKSQIIESAKEMGLPMDMDMNIIFNKMKKMLINMEKKIDNS